MQTVSVWLGNIDFCAVLRHGFRESALLFTFTHFTSFMLFQLGSFIFIVSFLTRLELFGACSRGKAIAPFPVDLLLLWMWSAIKALLSSLRHNLLLFVSILFPSETTLAFMIMDFYFRLVWFGHIRKQCVVLSE